MNKQLFLTLLVLASSDAFALTLRPVNQPAARFERPANESFLDKLKKHRIKIIAVTATGILAVICGVLFFFKPWKKRVAPVVVPAPNPGANPGADYVRIVQPGQPDRLVGGAQWQAERDAERAADQARRAQNAEGDRQREVMRLEAERERERQATERQQRLDAHEREKKAQRLRDEELGRQQAATRAEEQRLAAERETNRQQDEAFVTQLKKITDRAELRRYLVTLPAGCFGRTEFNDIKAAVDAANVKVLREELHKIKTVDGLRAFAPAYEAPANMNFAIVDFDPNVLADLVYQKYAALFNAKLAKVSTNQELADLDLEIFNLVYPAQCQALLTPAIQASFTEFCNQLKAAYPHGLFDEMLAQAKNVAELDQIKDKFVGLGFAWDAASFDPKIAERKTLEYYVRNLRAGSLSISFDDAKKNLDKILDLSKPDDVAAEMWFTKKAAALSKGLLDQAVVNIGCLRPDDYACILSDDEVEAYCAKVRETQSWGTQAYDAAFDAERKKARDLKVAAVKVKRQVWVELLKADVVKAGAFVDDQTKKHLQVAIALVEKSFDPVAYGQNPIKEFNCKMVEFCREQQFFADLNAVDGEGFKVLLDKVTSTRKLYDRVIDPMLRYGFNSPPLKDIFPDYEALIEAFNARLTAEYSCLDIDSAAEKQRKFDVLNGICDEVWNAYNIRTLLDAEIEKFKDAGVAVPAAAAEADASDED